MACAASSTATTSGICSMTFCSDAGSSIPHVGLARPGGGGPAAEVKIGLRSFLRCGPGEDVGTRAAADRANRGPTDSRAHTRRRADHGRPPRRRASPDAITGSAVNRSARKDWGLWMRSGRRTDRCRPGISPALDELDAAHTSTRQGSGESCQRGVRADRPEQADRRRVERVEREEVAGSTGLEPAASGVTGRRSNQLNYDPAKPFECNPNRRAVQAGE